MGACCPPSDQPVVLQDLPAPKPNPKDHIAVWEATLPFAKCSMKAYIHYLNLAHAASGGQGTVTLASLANNFRTPAWSDLKKAKSAICESAHVAYLESACSVEGQTSGSGEKCFDYKKLVMMGLLYCQDARKPVTKSIELYNLLQEGGYEKQ